MHFRKSVVETKAKHERRPTSGKGLLSRPLQDLLDDSDSDDGVLSIHSLASSISFVSQAAVDNSATKAASDHEKNVSSDAHEMEKSSENDNSKNVGGTSMQKDPATDAVTKPKKRVSS